MPAPAGEQHSGCLLVGRRPARRASGLLVADRVAPSHQQRRRRRRRIRDRSRSEAGARRGAWKWSHVVVRNKTVRAAGNLVADPRTAARASCSAEACDLQTRRGCAVLARWRCQPAALACPGLVSTRASIAPLTDSASRARYAPRRTGLAAGQRLTHLCVRAWGCAKLSSRFSRGVSVGTAHGGGAARTLLRLAPAAGADTECRSVVALRAGVSCDPTLQHGIAGLLRWGLEWFVEQSAVGDRFALAGAADLE
jgi:hypothetical protein